jgi:hypothetical protein
MLGRLDMRKIIVALIFSSIISSLTHASQTDNLRLTGKCAYLSATSEGKILPGSIFLYLFQNEETKKFFVIHSIAWKYDSINANSTELVGELPLIEATPTNGVLIWKQRDLFTGEEKNNWLNALSVPWRLGEKRAATGGYSSVLRGAPYAVCRFFN